MKLVIASLVLISSSAFASTAAIQCDYKYAPVAFPGGTSSASDSEGLSPNTTIISVRAGPNS